MITTDSVVRQGRTLASWRTGGPSWPGTSPSWPRPTSPRTTCAPPWTAPRRSPSSPPGRPRWWPPPAACCGPRSRSSPEPTWSSSPPGRPAAAAGVLLSAAALRASAAATHERLGGPGSWLLALPVSAIAGLQVLCRSFLAGRPVTVPHPGRPWPPRSPACPAGRRYTALVPTQLRRFLDAEPAALRAFDAVLVGGAATDAALLARARAEDVARGDHVRDDRDRRRLRVRRRPLDGVAVRVTDGIEVSGPTLALGYRLDPAATAAAFADGWFRTRDAGIAGRRRPAHRPRPARRRRHQRRGQRRAARRGGRAARAPGRRRRRRRGPARRGVGAAGRRRRRPRSRARRRTWTCSGRGWPSGWARPPPRARCSSSTPSRCCTRASPTGARSPSGCGLMATPSQWLAGARPRTLPAALAPVLVGTGTAAALDGVRPAARRARAGRRARAAGGGQLRQRLLRRQARHRRRPGGPDAARGLRRGAARQVLVAALLAFAVAGGRRARGWRRCRAGGWSPSARCASPRRGPTPAARSPTATARWARSSSSSSSARSPSSGTTFVQTGTLPGWPSPSRCRSAC